ncbi:myoD family inhibitor domain-containing protein-like [Xiphophorus hellerii]|uniref:myoD family inhibitor domain-containing protein-like n=1 Tax=Xiphophorus hellerii TaxID=8084 RepID=UPI0013B435AB|nr:myoD family inhibitor domain-containing protein-like [Xiphophorus hellerii]
MKSISISSCCHMTRVCLCASAQPLPAPAPLTKASGDRGVSETPRRDLPSPTCPRCGLPVPQSRPEPASRPQSRPQGSAASGRGDRSRSKRSGPGPDRPAPGSADSCLGLLLACLWCQFSVALLGLLEACSSCCLCSSCVRCCAAARDAPGEELGCPAHCHSVLFESCCEPVEFLEFCLDCCEICHRS